MRDENTFILYKYRIHRLFVPKFFHDRRNTNFLKKLRYIREHKPKNKILTEPVNFGRRHFEYGNYRYNPNEAGGEPLHPLDNLFYFPKKWYKNIGFTVDGFSFEFKNAPDTLKNILNPSNDLINDGKNKNIELIDNNLTEKLFFDGQLLLGKIEEYQKIPKLNFINESFFLYDKSNIIKKTFISALNKQLSIYGSFSYFPGSAWIKNLKLLDVSNSLKFLLEKKALKKDLKLQILYVSGKEVNTEDKKIHDFSITRLKKRRKNMLSEPVETVIIRAQQDFDVVGGLNPIQVQILDDTVLNILRKYKNVAYKITPLGLLFPASIINNTSHIFTTTTKISSAKKVILSYKIYDILADIDTDKINKWNEIKGESIWVNVQFKDHKELNNSNHLCFPFVTRTFSDLTSFTIVLLDDKNKKIEFKTGEKK